LQVNVALHGLVTALVLLVCSKHVFVRSGPGLSHPHPSPSPPPPSYRPLLCASLFAVHGVHTEAVISAVGRAELLSALFR
jgi:hypothetical protein